MRPDSFYVEAAQGWLELGNYPEAEAELNQVSTEAAAHPEVLHVRWHIKARQKNWEACIDIGRKMLEVAPDNSSGWINYANALFYLKRFKDAFDALYPALEKFPDNPHIPYNLACYECQLGHMERAFVWLRKALRSGSSDLKEMAANDPDLEPLRKEFGSHLIE